MTNQRIKTIVFLVLIFIITLILFNTDKKKFHNNKDISKNLVVINNTNFNIEKPTKIILNKVLSIDSIYVKLEIMPIEYVKSFYGLTMKDFFFDSHYVVYISPYLKDSILTRVLAHELIHVDQYERGDLIEINFYGGIYSYKGDTINANIVTHDNRPYEKDAFNRENEVISTYNKFNK